MMPPVIPGYRLGAVLQDSLSDASYEAFRIEDEQAAIVEVHSWEGDEGVSARIEHELALLSELNVAGAAGVLEMARRDHHWIAVFEREAGVNLRRFADRKPLRLEPFFDIAIGAAEILGQVHGRRVLHRNLTPTSVFFDQSAGRPSLASFGLSVVLQRLQRKIYDPQVLAGSLPYMSPEQTGRISRGVDARSDLYSLGVVFYELLLARCPFEATDPLALVHAHLAELPLPLSDARPEVPRPLSDVVGRMLAKDPSERYQSALGLCDDLKRCRRDWGAGQPVVFRLGSSDLPDTLRFPDRLYGRSAELAKLLEALARVSSGGVELVVIHGPPGMGKTALIQEIQGPLAGIGGFLVSGKFEQHRRDVPLLALRQALSALVDQLMAEDDRQIAARRRRALDVIGGVGGVLLELMPKLQLLLGPQPEVKPLGPLESQSRLLLAVKRLLIAVASLDRPLVLFIDDLQWSDEGSLQLLEKLVLEQQASGLLLIGASRPEPAVAAWLGDLGRKAGDGGPETTNVLLGPIPLAAVTELLEDTLRVGSRAAQELASVLRERTDNNPLLLRQMVSFLVDEGRLQRRSDGWQWNLEEIRGAGVPESAVSMVRAKMARLPAELYEVLAAASCVGSRFDLPRLSAALQFDAVMLLPILERLCELGLLRDLGEGSFSFSHDRIEEASAEELQAQVARSYHGRIGRFLLAVTPREKIGEGIFEIMEHLAIWLSGPDLLDSEEELDWLEIAQLSRLAGTKALATAAFEVGERHLALGIDVMARVPNPGNEPDLQALARELRIDHARCLSLAGRHEEAESSFDEQLSPELSPLAAGRVCAARVEVLAIRGDYVGAVEWGLRGLARCGLTIPRQLWKPRLWWLQRRVLFELGQDPRERILNLPECWDELALLRSELFARLVVPGLILGGDFYKNLILQNALNLLRYGYSPQAFFPLVAIGGQLARIKGKYSAGEPVARVAIEMCRGSGTVCRTVLGAIHSVLPFVQPYRDCLSELESAFAEGVEEGDVELAGFACVGCTTFSFVAGLPLREVIRAIHRADRYRTTAGMQRNLNRQQGLGRVCAVLMGEEPLGGLEMEWSAADIEGEPTRATEALWRAELGIFFGRYESSWELCRVLAKEAVGGVFYSTHYWPELVFVHGLAAAGCAQGLESSARSARRRLLYRTLKKARVKLLRWASESPSNFEHKALLLSAEIRRLEQRHEEAMHLYQRAADSAGHHGFEHWQALTLERYGELVTAQGWTDLWEAPIRRAKDLYSRWGAERKVEELEKALRNRRRTGSVNLERGEGDSQSAPFHALDLASVLKTSQAISEEMTVEGVVGRVLAAALENAGARRGVLFLTREDRLHMVAEKSVGSSIQSYGQPVPLAQCREIVTPLVHLAFRGGEPLVVADASADPRFAVDAYLDARIPRSVGCFPIFGRERSTGVLYLENELYAGVFTTERADVLRVLTAQAAISLENASLYEQQEKRVKTLSGFLPICARCKKIRDDAGDWNDLEVFIDTHSDASFSHGLCPSCFTDDAGDLFEGA